MYAYMTCMCTPLIEKLPFNFVRKILDYNSAIIIINSV